MTRSATGLGLALALLLAPAAATLVAPAAAFAGFALSVNPDRLDGEFAFEDKDEPNNQLQFTVQGFEAAADGQVTGNFGTDLVTISWVTNFPSKFAANERSAAVTQDRQVLVGLQVIPGEGSTTPAYFGQAAPHKCKAQAKIRDNEVNDPDDPDKAQAKVQCDLGGDFRDLDTDSDPETPGAPPAEVLNAVEGAFVGRKDVKVDASKGKIRIKTRGEPLPVP